jgi:hypothetical protein
MPERSSDMEPLPLRRFFRGCISALRGIASLKEASRGTLQQEARASDGRKAMTNMKLKFPPFAKRPHI